MLSSFDPRSFTSSPMLPKSSLETVITASSTILPIAGQIALALHHWHASSSGVKKLSAILKKTSNTNLRIKPVSKSDHVFLYELLLEREPIMNINHKKMPSFTEHVNFILSKPYAKWYTIVINDTKIGTVYLTHRDEIGIFIKKKFIIKI